MSDFISTNTKYKEWIKTVGSNFRQCQIKAASKVNEEMLMFYWKLGRDIHYLNESNAYGSDFYGKLSADLSKELPDIKSFSPRNLRYMKDFYCMYHKVPILQQVVAKSGDTEVTGNENVIFQIPWGHHIQILNKCKDNPEKALFFVNQVIENNWSRAVLMNFLDTNLYERQGKAITNFEKILPDTQSDLAQEMTKDPYNFDFLTLRQNYDEKELKDALMKNVQKFLLELGKGFAFEHLSLGIWGSWELMLQRQMGYCEAKMIIKRWAYLFARRKIMYLLNMP